MRKTLEAWLADYPFLEPIARLEATVRECVDALPRPGPDRTDFEAHRSDFAAGIPLLHGAATGPRLLADAAGSFAALGEALAGASLAAPLAGKLAELRERLRATGTPPERVLVAIVTDASLDPAPLPHPGTARYVAWRALAHALAPTLAAFAAWREHETWTLGRCPTCGALPLLSLLTPHAEGRQRSLACGLCGSRWPVQRIGCPHCGTEDETHLALLELEHEPRLRLDVCNVCQGYLKTWTGVEPEAPFFSDWATLHLDAVAAEHGYRRLGASLYDV